MAGVPLYISGLGTAVPGGRIGDTFLQQVGVTVPAGAPTARATAVAQGYLQETLNRDPYDAVAHLSETPTALGIAAGQRALAQAGLAVTDIGLMIGESVTPLETTPSEVQRVGGGMGYKGPAYDVVSITATWARYVTLLQAFQDSRVPPHTLLVSTHTPTARIAYTSGSVEGALFGDGAGAVVLSREPAPSGAIWKIAGAVWLSDSARDPLVEVSLYGSMSVRPLRSDLIRVQLDQLASQLGVSAGADVEFDVVVWNLPWSVAGDTVLSHPLLGGKRRLISTAETGYQFGASDIAALIDCASTVTPGRRVLLLSADGGIHCGAVLLERC